MGGCETGGLYPHSRRDRYICVDEKEAEETLKDLKELQKCVS